MKAELFEFSGYKFEPLKKRVIFYYKICFKNQKEASFKEEIFLPKIPKVKNLPKSALDSCLESVHLMLGISYYKLYCPKKIATGKIKLSREQADFWNNVYTKGLGEFFYRNKIDFRGLIKFPYIKNKKTEKNFLKLKNRSLVGIGGGKESVVVLELLLRKKKEITSFNVESGNKSDAANDLIKISKTKSLKIKRIIDKKLFDENKKPETFNGHIPISAVYAFLGVLSGILYDYAYFIVGNEHSSNFGNIKYLGKDINHQWSKSQEFESLLRDYVDTFITPGFRYFSLLRPFYEIRIARMFSSYGKYFNIFTSCNKSFTIHKKRSLTKWCGQCPKCVFVFIMLSAFLSRKKVIEIFDKNLYSEKVLLQSFRDILGLGKMKPFDCVGTFTEARVAFNIGKKKFKNDFIVKNLSSSVKVSKKEEKEVFLTRKSLNIPTQFKFLGMESVLILGYGKEGKSTREYVKKNYPTLKIGIADYKKQGKRYLHKQEKYDIAVKTPGIRKEEVNSHYTTATNIFFSELKGKNRIIGVTGSKGKSTTSSLIHHLLSAAGEKSVLLGNIGSPALDHLLESKISKKNIIVLELSSYQLDDLEFSPDIAVVTNLFPDHINYHQGVENYYNAKRKIISYQDKNDIFIYNKKNPLLRGWARESFSNFTAFNNIGSKKIKTNLLGKHNQNNIKAAIAVALVMGVSFEKIIKSVSSFYPLSHRMEYVGKFSDINFWDDAISTTPESTIEAIKTIPNIETIFLGGEDRGYNFSELEKIIYKSSIKNIVLFPETGKRIFNKKNKFNILRTKNMEKAISFAYKNTSKGKACLLSTASPSYFLWRNYEHKGNEFKKYIKKLNV